MTTIYKILTPHEWEAFQKNGIFEGSAMDLKDGFIHCALDSQYKAIKEKYFKDQRPLVLVEIDTQKLETGSLKIEANRKGGTEYPHLYSALTLNSLLNWSYIE
jgi:uncharacterized protein (DUF952 family)